MNNLELKGDGLKLRINPYSDTIKELKFLRKMDGTLSDMAKLEGEIEPISCGYDEEGNFYVSPHHGPTLVENYPIPSNPRYLIKKIHYVADKDYYIFNIIENKLNDLSSNSSESIIQ